uniref:Ig-like domain-containing protein n=1 Tax=Leptobrachium leishanense TaxID=445787 RepID=A0A8C5PUP5_9ANUR
MTPRISDNKYSFTKAQWSIRRSQRICTKSIWGSEAAINPLLKFSSRAALSLLITVLATIVFAFSFYCHFFPDLSVKHRVAVGVASFLTVFLAAGAIFLVYHHRHKKRNIPRVREITRCGDGTFSLDVDRFAPKDISFSWHLIQPPSSTEKQQLESTLIMSENQDGTFNATSTCDNLRGKVNVTQPYTIQAAVTHRKLKQPVCNEWTSDPQDGYKLRPIVTRPLQLSLCDPGEVLCSLNLESFYPKHIDISWSCDTGQSQKNISSQEKYQENPDQSYNAESACKIPGDSLNDPEFKVIVRWKHETMEDWESRELRVRDPVSPTVTEPIKFSLCESGDVLCSLYVSKFYPQNINITWTSGRDQINKIKAVEKFIQIRDEKTYDAISECRIKWDQSLFPLRVTWKHESMEKPEYKELEITACAPRVGDIIVPGQLQCNQLAILQCEISAFYLDNLTVTWSKIQKGKEEETIDSQSKEKYYIPDLAYKKQDNTYNCTARLVFIPSYDLDLGAVFICKVQHPNLEPQIERRTKPLQLDQAPGKPGDTGKNPQGINDSPPHVDDIIVPRQLQCNQSYTLQCQISGFYPDNLTVTWLKHHKGEEETIQLQSNERYQIPALQHVKQWWTHTYRCTASLVSIPSYESDDGAEFICRVEHPSLKGAIEKRTGPLNVKDFPPRLGDIIVPRQLQCNQSYTLQCQISGFYPDNLTVTWLKHHKGEEETIQLQSNERYQISDLRHEKQRDHTYRCTASLVSIPSYESDDGAVFICRVEHPSLKEPIEKRTGPLNVKDFPPRLGDIIVPRQLQCNQSYTLQCQISGFYPDNLTVTWLKHHKGEEETIQLQSNERYQISDLRHEKQRDHTYRCTARLVSTPSYESDDGAVFICRVEHPSLKPPIEKRTKPLNVKVPMVRERSPQPVGGFQAAGAGGGGAGGLESVALEVPGSSGGPRVATGNGNGGDVGSFMSFLQGLLRLGRFHQGV